MRNMGGNSRPRNAVSTSDAVESSYGPLEFVPIERAGQLALDGRDLGDEIEAAAAPPKVAVNLVKREIRSPCREALCGLEDALATLLKSNGRLEVFGYSPHAAMLPSSAATCPADGTRGARPSTKANL